MTRARGRDFPGQVSKDKEVVINGSDLADEIVTGTLSAMASAVIISKFNDD